MLSVAALAEVLAYYVPGVDNLLDSLATPAALIARTVVSAAVMTDLPPMVKWTAAVIAGGGVAGLTQGVTAMLRAKSTILTGGLGNSVIATAELGVAPLVSLLTLAAPLAALALVILFLWLAIGLLRQLFRGVRPSNSPKIDADLSVYRHLRSTEGTIQAEKSRPNIQEIAGFQNRDSVTKTSEPDLEYQKPKPRRNTSNTIPKVNKTVPAATPIIPVTLITRPMIIFLSAMPISYRRPLS